MNRTQEITITQPNSTRSKARGAGVIDLSRYVAMVVRKLIAVSAAIRNGDTQEG